MLGGTEMIGDMYGTSQHSPQDVMYFLVEGEAVVSLSDGAVTMREGDVLCVAAGTPSALAGADPDRGFKLLQLAIPVS